MTIQESNWSRRTKIVATLGPTSSSPEIIRAMVKAGLSVARLNFSHGSHVDLKKMITHIRAAEKEFNQAVAIVGDLQGPKIRIGVLDNPLDLVAGDSLTIDCDSRQISSTIVSCDYPELIKDVKVNDSIFLKDGAIELTVSAVNSSAIETVVQTDGRLTSRAGINLPGIALKIATLTDKDLDDMRFAVDEHLDYLALSFIRSEEDALLARSKLDDLGSDMRLIAKIENIGALKNLNSIITAVDGVMVARGDLGVEVGSENVPIWQRRIIRTASEHLVPVVIATQMLESMIGRSRPTRAEASDVANAVWDGADALMLSAESAIGTDPVHVVEMMARIIDRAEEEEGGRSVTTFDTNWWQDSSRSISWAIRSIVEQNAEIRGVVAFTITGYTARLIAKDRVRVPVFVLAPHPSVERRVSLLWGVHPIPCPPPRDLDSMLKMVDDIATNQMGYRSGDLIVLAGGIPLGEGKPTNFLKLHIIGENKGPADFS